jgi:hypothetical protein
MLNRNFESVTSDDVLLDELVAVLAPAPAGLRRWSVMNAIRRNRRAAGRDIPLKMEAEVERTFRRFCAADGARACTVSRFSRPAETAGEVWALNPAWAPQTTEV